MMLFLEVMMAMVVFCFVLFCFVCVFPMGGDGDDDGGVVMMITLGSRKKRFWGRNGK